MINGKRSRSGSFEVELPKKVKICKFNARILCFDSSCVYLDMGNIRLCRFHPNSSSRFRRRKVSPSVLECSK